MKNLFVIFLFLSLATGAFAQVQAVPFTLDDRDRIMRTEEQLKSTNEKIESLRNEINARFEAVDQRFDAVDQRFETMESKFDLIYWLFGILFALILFFIGFIMWDRRTALYPIQDKTRDLDDRVVKLESLAREQARNDPAFADLLKLAGLL
jgi:phosphoglycerate-specific signal transduction histidine kinase